MKKCKRASIFITCLIIVSSILFCGCEKSLLEMSKTGEYYRLMISLGYEYGVRFSDQNAPTVAIQYCTDNGISKTAIFQLDGFDAEKKIGYKLVLKKDISEWEESRKKGAIGVPDINDFPFIQAEAMRYKFPIIFMWAYQYQEETNQAKMRANIDEHNRSFQSLIKTPEMKKWAEEGMYSGQWTKGYLDETFSYYGIQISHSDLPIVEIVYGEGDNKKAVFQLDGYDPKRQIGYKFVTAEDEINWNKRISEGDMNAPNLADSDLIKEEALVYDFPVFFIYVPEYWKTLINEAGEEILGGLNTPYFTQWLKEHK